MADHTQDAERVRRALELYADSYDSMAKMGEGKVSAADVAFDVRQNMVGSVLAVLEARRSILQGDEPAHSSDCDNKGCAGCVDPDDLARELAAQGDELPPLSELPRPNCTYADHSYPAFSKGQMQAYAREYGAACRAGRAKGEDARDA